MMGSIIALRRSNQKHWQARLSCSNCMPPCSSVLLAKAPDGTELEFQLSSYDTDEPLSKYSSKPDFPLEFLPCSASNPEPKSDIPPEAKPECKPGEKQEKPETEDKKDLNQKASKSKAKVEKPPKPGKKDKKAESKAAKATAKAEDKKDIESVDCKSSNLNDSSTKTIKSDFDSLAQSNTDSCFSPCNKYKDKDKDKGPEAKMGKKKTKPPKPAKPPKEPKSKPKLEKKSSAKTKSTKPKEKDKKKKPQHEKMKAFEPKKLKNYPTFTQIGGSVSHNCCSCMEAMTLYIKEFLRFSCSLTAGRPAQDTQFQERVCDMLHILRTMGRDCFCLLRYVMRLLFVD